MKLLIDDANIDEIRRLYDLYPIDGVTTNPSILAKSGRQPYDVLKEIREFIGEEADLHVQVIAKRCRRHDRRCTSYCKGIGTKHICEDSLYSRRLQSDEGT